MLAIEAASTWICISIAIAVHLKYEFKSGGRTNSCLRPSFLERFKFLQRRAQHPGGVRSRVLLLLTGLVVTEYGAVACTFVVRSRVLLLHELLLFGGCFPSFFEFT